MLVRAGSRRTSASGSPSRSVDSECPGRAIEPRKIIAGVLALLFEKSRGRELHFLHSSDDGIEHHGEAHDHGQGTTRLRVAALAPLFAAGAATGLSDGELLERYTAKRAESAEAKAAAEMAFGALVDRHGAMVWRVCSRVLGDAHEAEDAFQATFLILVRKARSVRVEGSLGRWLYGVAHRVALRARTEAQRRVSGAGRFPPASCDDPAGETELSDLRAAVGEELDRLPAKYRCPVELCHLQGMTYDEAARQLNWPAATVKNRLGKGRLKLRERLARRGLAPGAIAVGLATALADEARAAVPPELVHSTARAATACVAGAFPAAVTQLTRSVLKMMMWEKLERVAFAALAALGLGLSAQALSQQAPNGRILATRSADKPNDKTVRDRRWVRSLPCGAIIEVVGLSSVPSGPDTWWRPTGRRCIRRPATRRLRPSRSTGTSISGWWSA